MNLELFITRKVALEKKSGFANFIIRIAILATALSLATIIVSSSMVRGFRYEISDKIYNIWGHIQIKGIESGISVDDYPIHNDVNKKLKTIKGVSTLQSIVVKAAIIKTKDEIESLLFKGISTDFDWNSFKVFIKEGKPIALTDTISLYPIIISETTAKRLKIKLNEKLAMYLTAETGGNIQMRTRVCKVVGIYNTGLSDFDKNYSYCSSALLQKINGWASNQYSMIEISLKNNEQIDDLAKTINEDYLDPTLQARSIKDVYPNLFDWLSLQKLNERIIMILMIVVAIVNLITMLLILILERANFIGIMKAIGASNGLIQRVFILQATYIVSWGLLIGNLVGLAICWIQKYFKIIKLPEDSYFINYAPVSIDYLFILELNLFILLLCMVVMVVPSWLVSRILPTKVLRFE
jgi:lipoprotein-releasing system permease protein